MATDVADTLARSMSLSRRYLSLPQELAGTSLPPKVSGKRRGVVTLSVAHILPSAVSSAPLPRESLVRVRWWGEETPGSLFRPSLLSGDGEAEDGEAPHSPQRVIAMKYPVSVLPEQLLEYFQDMGHLTLDVIDRQSRRKVGQCWLPLDVHKDNEVMTAEEKLVALRRDDVLCEIKPSGGDDGDVAGYLAVTFGVKWTESPVEVEEDGVAVESVENEESLVAASNASDETRGKLEAERTEQMDDFLLKRRRRKVSVENRGTSEGFQRIQKLLAKGKALQQSMERAVTEVQGDHGEELDVGLAGEEHGLANVAVDDAMQQMRKALLLKFDAEPASQWDKVSAGDGRLPNVSKSKLPAFSFELDNDIVEQQDPTASPTLLKGLNALKIRFESMELDRDFVDNQLRQLRDSSNVSSRFSPIQVRVSHDDISSLMYPHLAGANVPEVPAFAVTTSLRTHQWQLECSSTMSLTPPASLIGNTSTEGSSIKWRDNDKRLRFFVRCENRSDARRSQKRHEQNLFPRASKRVLLEGAVDSSVLLAVAVQTDKTWATTVQLNLVSDIAESNILTSGKQRVDKVKSSRNKKLCPVGCLKLNFEFFNVNPDYQSSVSEGRSAENEAVSELLLSSISASSSEADPKRQAELLSFSEKSVPFVDVDDGHPIENPFTGQLAGFLRARICLGTADQLLNWAKTIRAVVKLQAVTRRVFSRKHFRCSRSVGIGTSDAPEKRLKPACIALSFHLLSMIDFEYLLNEKSRQLFAETSAGMYQSSVHLRDILNRGRDTQFALFDVTICLGGELDERENVFRQEERLIRDTAARVFVENGKWYKRWRSPEVTIRVIGGSQIERFDTISPQLAMQAHMQLNPDTVATLQEACAEVAVLLSCSTCGEPHELGCVDVPLAAVLFRPQGVRGMFPVRMGEESSGARVGVHCFVNHDPPRAETDVFQRARNDNVSRFTDIQLKPAPTPPPLMSPTSPDEIVRAEGELLISRPMKSCEVCVEEGRNLIVNDGGATPRSYAAFRIAKERENQALQEPFVTPEKRTGVRAGMCPQWNYRDTLNVDKVDWQSVSLEVSVWQDNKNRSTGFHPARRSQSDQLENDVYVGMARVDLSLFHCGWSDVDGWYHIQDAQHQTRGQVKIHVRNLRIENTLNPTKVVSSWGPQQTEPAGDFDQQYPGSITDDKAATLQFSLGKVVQAVHQASAEIEERLAIFQMPEKDSQADASPCTNLVFDLNKTTGKEGDTLKPSNTTPCADLQELVSDAQDAEAEVDGPDGPDRADDIDDIISDPNDDSSASNDDDSDSKSLELNADYFKPVTLASFGIEEMEFSPLAEDEARADENEQDTIAESAEEGAVVDDQFGILKCGEEEKKLRGTTRSSGSGVGNEESHDIDGLWREAPSEQRTVPEQTKIDTPVKDVASVGFDSDIDGEDTFSMRLANSTTTSEEEVIEGRNRGSSRNDGAFSTNSASLSDGESSVSSGGAASELDSDVIDDDKDATVQADHSHVAHKPSPKSTVTMNMIVEKANALDTIVAGTAADTVPGYNMDLADQSCGNVAAPSETVMDFDTGKEVQLESDASSAGPISASEVQYADKATQVGPFELGLQVEMVACSVQTAPSMDPKQECDEVVSEDVDDDANLSDLAEEAKQAVDVGCDAMDVPIEKHRQSVNVETLIPRPQGVVELVSNPSVSSVEQPSSSNQARSCLQEETHRRVSSLNNSEAHTTLQNEKIELVYEMLREMRDTYLAKPDMKSASGGANDCEYSEEGPKRVTVPNNPLVHEFRDTSDSRSSCPGSPISRPLILHRVARKLSLDGSFASASGLATSNIMVNDKKGVSDKRCSCSSSPLAREPRSLRSRGVSLHENVSMTMGKPACAFESSSKKTSFQVQSIGRRAESMSPDFDYHSPASGRMVRTSLRDTEGRRGPRENIGSISRLSSSDVRAVQRRSSLHNSQVEGTMNYWMKEDSSSSCDDEVDGEEDTDDNCYF
ncbi:Lysophospholipid acyltransferase 1 [Phytophthora pseudosyringae]|uniref:Lysophospholipid acyltransferase 1 n=1 Tax=Phytophthora pseudosyringae TaxID=221518 RepID=A0A8T1W4S0_9STRA|nr:Lysophospholipid acyltransferase 1 [Phytophthora pseudosyringae]